MWGHVVRQLKPSESKSTTQKQSRRALKRLRGQDRLRSPFGPGRNHRARPLQTGQEAPPYHPRTCILICVFIYNIGIGYMLDLHINRAGGRTLKLRRGQNRLRRRFTLKARLVIQLRQRRTLNLLSGQNEGADGP